MDKIAKRSGWTSLKGREEVSSRMSHKDGDPEKTKEEYDADNHADQLNPNNDEYEQDWGFPSIIIF